MLIDIDCQFMTCTHSNHRIGELSHKKRQQQQQQREQEQHREHHKAEEEAADIEITGGFAKVPLYYETTTSILPLPPFLSNYLSATTRTVFDKLPSIVYDVNEEKRTRTNNTEKDALGETPAAQAGERSVREIIRTMDVMSNDPNEGRATKKPDKVVVVADARVVFHFVVLCVCVFFFSLRVSHCGCTCHFHHHFHHHVHHHVHHHHSNETIDEICAGRIEQTTGISFLDGGHSLPIR